MKITEVVKIITPSGPREIDLATLVEYNAIGEGIAKKHRCDTAEAAALAGFGRCDTFLASEFRRRLKSQRRVGNSKARNAKLRFHVPEILRVMEGD